jgi:DNA-binding LacI/PurR family transcriptional regulator
MNGFAKHLAISRQLRESIAGGIYSPGARLPSESQLVRQWKVSRPTVARALLDLQREGLVERRAGSGTYVRNPSAPISGSQRQLGLLIPGLGTTEIFELVCGELASLARAMDYALLWGGSTHPRHDTDASVEHAEELCQQFIQRKVNGVFFAPYELVPGKELVNRRLAESLRLAGIPVVLLDRDLQSFPHRSDFDLVGIDNVGGGFLLADHLIKLGCRRICFVARHLSAPTVDARVAGVREAFVRHGLEPGPGWVRLGDPSDLKFVRSLTPGFLTDAFICANDHTASILLKSLEAIGVKVPRDVRLVGFDDVRYATLLGVPLTTIHQPRRDIAATALRAMIDRMNDPSLPSRAMTLTPQLVVRESCGAYLGRADIPGVGGRKR